MKILHGFDKHAARPASTERRHCGRRRPKPLKLRSQDEQSLPIPENAALVFLTEHANLVVRTTTSLKAAKIKKAELSATMIDRVTSDFRDLQKELKIYQTGGGVPPYGTDS